MVYMKEEENQDPSIVGLDEEAQLEEVDRIREVWNFNLDEEIWNICQVVKDFPYIAMDTEFPGEVAKPTGEFASIDELKYKTIKCNVDLLKIIQLGLTFFNKMGETPDGVCTWQFNFKFNISEDMYASDSCDLLQRSGIQFHRHESDGIDTQEFAEKLFGSGTVLMSNVTWLAFHGSSDFAYLLSVLTTKEMPKEEEEFFENLKVYFPNIYDVKFMMGDVNLWGGLKDVAVSLGVERIGYQHQAGSDSLLTGEAFFRMKKQYFNDELDDTKYLGYLYGLSTNHVRSSSTSELPLSSDEAL